jgi:hypothetical protein
MFLFINRLSVCSLVVAVTAARGQSLDLGMNSQAAATGTATFVSKVALRKMARLGNLWVRMQGTDATCGR